MQPRGLLLMLLCATALAATGCADRHLVRAAPPSVSTPPPEVEASPAPPPAPPSEPVPDAITTRPVPQPAPPEPTPAPAKRPAPRPRQPEAAETAPAAPTPTPPQISPQLSPQDLESAKSTTNADIATAQKNLQQANGKKLTNAQKDLVNKINGFLAQARDAIHVEDWVRAQSLADKARILSGELGKSL